MANRVLRYQAAAGGKIALWSDWESHDPTRTVVVVLHGAMRNAPTLAHWGSKFEGYADVVLMELPGHGRSAEIPSPTIFGMADSVLMAISDQFSNRKVTLVGESLGGLIGLDIAGREDPGPIISVVACAPPMTSAKLWNVQQNLLRILNDGNLKSSFIESMADNVFGITRNNIEERIYYDVLGKIRLPVLVVTGDCALLPARKTHGVACLFDYVDRFILETYHPGKAQFRIVSNCDHLLLVNAVESMETIIMNFMNSETLPNL